MQRVKKTQGLVYFWALYFSYFYACKERCVCMKKTRTLSLSGANLVAICNCNCRQTVPLRSMDSPSSTMDGSPHICPGTVACEAPTQSVLDKTPANSIEETLTGATQRSLKVFVATSSRSCSPEPETEGATKHFKHKPIGGGGGGGVAQGGGAAAGDSSGALAVDADSVANTLPTTRKYTKKDDGSVMPGIGIDRFGTTYPPVGVPRKRRPTYPSPPHRSPASHDRPPAPSVEARPESSESSQIISFFFLLFF
jgi:hypothetical protein